MEFIELQEMGGKWYSQNLPQGAPLYNKSLSIKDSLIFPINE